MRILIVPDCDSWAISNLCKGIKKHLDKRFDIEIEYVHPREVGMAAPTMLKHLKKGVDLINYHYWRSATQLLELIPRLKQVPSILTHHNHESLDKDDWSSFNYLTHFSKWGTSKLKSKGYKVKHISHGIDLNRFSFIQDYPPKEIRIGYIGRVADWKNLGFICKNCKELGYKVVGSGYIDKPEYWHKEVEQYAKDGTLEFNGGMGRNQMMPSIFKDNLYKRMTVYVMASEGEYESGPLGPQEAMARGIPVLSTPKGTMRDRGEDKKNIIFFRENDDNDFKTKLKNLVEDEALRMKLRKHGWQTAKDYSEERMAWEFGKLYSEVYSNFKK